MSALDNHIKNLTQKHSTLDQAVSQENSRPHPDSDTLFHLKAAKLNIKDEIEKLTHS